MTREEMTKERVTMLEIGQATLQEREGVMALLRANHADNLGEAERRDGFVTTNMTPEQMTALIAEENGVTIARDGARVTAFALAAPWGFWSQWPFFRNMIRILGNYRFGGATLTEENSYQYGPVCVNRDYRGRGVFERVFAASLRTMEDRYPIMVTCPAHAPTGARKCGKRKRAMLSRSNGGAWRNGQRQRLPAALPPQETGGQDLPPLFSDDPEVV